jgi:hypothetical protein
MLKTRHTSEPEYMEKFLGCEFSKDVLTCLWWRAVSPAVASPLLVSSQEAALLPVKPSPSLLILLLLLRLLQLHKPPMRSNSIHLPNKSTSNVLDRTLSAKDTAETLERNPMISSLKITN